MKNLFPLGLTFRTSCLLFVLVGFQAAGTAATVSQTATDAANTYTFNNGTHFSTVAAPTAGNDYVDPSFTMRTADVTTGTTTATGASYAFAGDSLTIGNGTVTTIAAGTSLPANLLYKGSITGLTVTVNNFIANFGEFTNGAGSGSIGVTLAGAVTVQSGGFYLAPNTNTAGPRTITTTASISGTGGVFVVNQDNTGVNANDGRGLLTFAGTNTYRGGTTIGSAAGGTFSNAAGLSVNAGSTLGIGGNVSVLATGALTLNGTANLGNTQSLVLDSALASSKLISLNYTGTDVISGLSLGGTVEPQDGSTYGAVGSGATFTSDYFTGTGLLRVAAVPEPSTVAGVILLVAAFGGYTLRQRRGLGYSAPIRSVDCRR